MVSGVYRLQADVDNFPALLSGDEAFWIRDFSEFRGAPYSGAWSALPVTWYAASKKVMRRGGSDFPYFHALLPVFSARAVSDLGDLLEGNGELLPLRCDGGSYFAYNVTCVIDALDREESVIHHTLEGSVTGISRHVFKPGSLDGAAIFKMPYPGVGGVYVAEPFVHRVRERGLTGFEFEELP